MEEEERREKEERSAAFQGSGFRLGDSEGPSAVIRGAQGAIKPTGKVTNSFGCFDLTLDSSTG